MLGKRANAEEESGRLVETPINCSNNGARSLVTTDIYCSQCCKLRSFERWNQSPIIVHSTRQHGTTWRADHRLFRSTTLWSDYRLFRQSTQYHMAVR